MKRLCFFLITCMFIISCKTAEQNTKHVLTSENSFLITEVSTDKTYGYTESNPIKVGSKTMEDGPLNERRFLNALAGPGGEPIKYERLGSCCFFSTKNGFMGGGLLDKYEVTWTGQREPVVLYLNMYDPGPLKCPVGFTIRGR